MLSKSSPSESKLAKPPKQPKPVSDRQRAFFRYQLDLIAEGKKPTVNCSVDYIRQMAGEGEVTRIELSPEEAASKLKDLKEQSKSKYGPRPQRRWEK